MPSPRSVGSTGATAAALKMKNFRRVQHRSSPYAVPPSSRACDTQTLGSSPTSRGPSQLRKWNHQRRRYPSTCMNTNQGNDRGSGVPSVGGDRKKEVASDPVDPEDPFEMLQELINDGSLVKEAVRRLQKGLYTSPTVKTFYDSEDDEGGRTPPNLCCEVGL